MSRSRLIDAALLVALVVGAVWLGSLVYHNRLGGHVQSPLDVVPAVAVQAARYEVVAVYPHDPGAYTQGLFWHAGALYEGTGRKGESSLRKVDLESGEIVERVDLPWELFGEGIALLGGRIYQLTWLSNTGLIYDAATLERIGTFGYETEGWGLTADDRHLIMSDGSENLYFLDIDTGSRVRTLPVFDESGGVDQLNELEFINGYIWANVWRSDEILQIDPATGKVVDRIDFSDLLAGERPRDPEAVLNGIAYDTGQDRLFLTGKLWPRLFEVRLIEPTR